ncbi:MAG: type II toxin-antitoxin system VapB family antitoxin [Gammaproteobacteria bacterium]
MRVEPTRINIVVDEALLREALKPTGRKTKKDAAELGLKTWIDLKKQEKSGAIAPSS